MSTSEVLSVQPPTPRLLGIKEAATYLGCTVWAIRSLIWDHKIPSITLGKRLLLDKADLDDFVEQNKVDKRKQMYGKAVRAGVQ